LVTSDGLYLDEMFHDVRMGTPADDMLIGGACGVRAQPPDAAGFEWVLGLGTAVEGFYSDAELAAACR
jgi:hypothetical protein